MNKKLFLAVPMLAVLALTGCAQNTEPTPTPAETIAPVATGEPNPNSTPGGDSIVMGGYTITPANENQMLTMLAEDSFESAVYPASNQEFMVILFGSSSCEPTVEDVSSVDGGLLLALKDWSGEACTDDLRPTGWVISSTANFDWDTMKVWASNQGKEVELPVIKADLPTPTPQPSVSVDPANPAETPTP